ncbi:MAG TPA: hypothetical protein PLQ52_08995 [Lacunisphaera sp.]|jgi:glycerophosphoryl diester phosphodiesterase|nr:hypothetical protein [Lacunisphaera sp.]HQY06186.1 hypothetical protein [Lacunisphaera sp.]
MLYIYSFSPRLTAHRPAADATACPEREIPNCLNLCWRLILPILVGAPVASHASGWNLSDHVPAEQIIIQGHRGGGLAEENTAEGYQLAWDMGLYQESGLLLTSDGAIVPFPDADFSRLVKGAPPELIKKGVKDLTCAYLAKLDVGSGQGEQFKERHVVPISAVFEPMRGRPNRHLYMDVKDIEFQKFAGVTQLQIHVYPMVTDDTWVPPADESSADNPFHLPNTVLHQVGQELRVHDVIFQAFPCTPVPQVYGQLLDLGVISFATDHPDIALREINAYYAALRTAAS